MTKLSTRLLYAAEVADKGGLHDLASALRNMCTEADELWSDAKDAASLRRKYARLLSMHLHDQPAAAPRLSPEEE